MEKLFNYLVLIFIAAPMLKVITFYIIQRLLHPKAPDKRTSQIDAEAKKISVQFNKLLKANQLSREDILIIKQMLKKYACKSYQNDCHLIYSVLKHGNIRMNELGSLEVFLDNKMKKVKC